MRQSGLLTATGKTGTYLEQIAIATVVDDDNRGIRPIFSIVKAKGGNVDVVAGRSFWNLVERYQRAVRLPRRSGIELREGTRFVNTDGDFDEDYESDVRMFRIHSNSESHQWQAYGGC